MGTSSPTTTTTTPMNIKTQTPIITPSTPRVSDLDALMAEKHLTNNKSPNVEIKPSIIPPAPIINNIRRSLFSTDSVKVVRPVRSQELKIFSSHLITEPSKQSSPKKLDDISSPSNINETLSNVIVPISPTKQKPDTHIPEINDNSSSNISTVLRDLSEDSLNSLNEHYHIRQLLKSSKYTN